MMKFQDLVFLPYERVLKILISLTIILPFIVFLTPRRQGLHDLACGTIVKGGERRKLIFKKPYLIE